MLRQTVLLILALMVSAPAQALTQDDILSARILPGWQVRDGSYMAALELTLAPEWKTYWRAPGEAGIPPLFDWSASENLRAVRLHWPSPVVFHTNGMQTIGYHDGLVLPLEVIPRDPNKPVHLSLMVDLGICKDICMPAVLAVKADLVGAGEPDAAIKSALAARPATAKEAGLASISCEVQPISDGLRLTARMELPQRSGPETVVFEAADKAIWIAEAQSSREGRILTAVTDLVPGSGEPFALDRSSVTVTVLANGRSVEIKGCPAP